MRDELRKYKLGLALLIVILLDIDAEIVRRLYLHGFSLVGGAEHDGYGPNLLGHEPTLIVLSDCIVLGFIAALHVGAGWLFWQLRVSKKRGESFLLRMLRGGEPVLWSENSLRDFRFQSAISAVAGAKALGLILLWLSLDFVRGWTHPSWHRLPSLVLALPIALFFWAAAGLFLFGFCQIQIGEGQLSFRRFFAWRSVPLESISRVKRRWFGVDVTVNHKGKRFRFFFDPEDNSVGPSPPLVIQFLQELCRRNARESHAVPEDTPQLTAHYAQLAIDHRQPTTHNPQPTKD